MIVRKAVILAGGLGTRLQSALPETPKCMAPVHRVPFLYYLLDYLAGNGINEVILSVGYRKEQIINTIGSSFHKIKIHYSIENEPLGTGGALKLALKQCSSELVLVLNGDTYFTPDLKAMARTHAASGAKVTIALRQADDISRYGSVIADGTGRITSFNEKSENAGSGLINGGIYMVTGNLFENFEPDRFSLEKDFFAPMCGTLHMLGFVSDGVFLDIGTPEDYARAEEILAKPRPPLNTLKP